MELLVVLLIIGILSTVALRTIDATRDRSLFDQTTKEMNQLVQAIVGNPDLAYDGRRVDFGYYGDMEELPESLEYLVRNPGGSTAWRGPYFKLMSAGDLVSYLNDGWGNLYTYNPTLGTIHTEGNGKFPMTVKIADSLPQLYDNIISGTITDHDDNAPDSIAASSCTLRLHYNNRDAHGGDSVASVVLRPGGYYEISSSTDGGSHVVPIGIHKLVAKLAAAESLVRYVTVAPRSKTIVDFKFSTSFWNKLRMSGSPQIPQTDSSSFGIHVVNIGSEVIAVDSLNFLPTSELLYMRDFRIEGASGAGYPITPGNPGTGPGQKVAFQSSVQIAPDMSQEVELWFLSFYADPNGGPPPANVHDKTFKFRFSDGSVIEVTP
jgi:type II secretory pathway pseudopilin PulG